MRLEDRGTGYDCRRQLAAGPTGRLSPMKTWWQSKTIWVAIITILVAGLTQFTDVVAISPEVKNYILGAVGILNLVLRLFSTSVPIEPAAKVKRFNG